MIDIRLNFIKVNPVENMTVFIMNPIPRDLHKKISKKIMGYDNLCAEQVGFIEPPSSKKGKEKKSIRLQMMGGEFCGNAARSLAAILVYNEYPNLDKCENDGYSIDLEVSGVENLVNCKVWQLNSNKFESEVDMPLPNKIEEIYVKENDLELKVLKVELPGIIHLIVNSKVKNKENIFKILKKQFNNCEALGIMFYDEKANYLEPLVYVKATDSLFWEKSCASGTCALGAALAYTYKKDLITSVKEPGGKLQVSVKVKNDKIKYIKIKGLVEIISEGSVYLN